MDTVFPSAKEAPSENFTAQTNEGKKTPTRRLTQKMDSWYFMFEIPRQSG